MDRRTLLVGSVGLLAAPLAAEAQQAGKVWRIGYLGISAPTPRTLPIWQAFLQGLRDHGYVEGQNLVIERRYSEGKEERFAALVTELLQLKVDVIVVGSTAAAHAAKAATSSIPIVMVGILDPERTGLILDFAGV